MSLQVIAIESMPFAENSYVLWKTGRSDAIVVDPGFEPDKIVDELRRRSLRPALILNTHGHVDHIAGNAAMKQVYPEALLVIGRNDAAMLTDADLNLSGPFGVPIVSPPADRLVDEGEMVDAAGMAFEVLAIPGHSPGHVVYVHRDGEVVTVLGGDVVFAGSIGRTDFPGGDLKLLLRGIRDKMWPLPDAAVIHPGHGPATTVGAEKRDNPFCSINALREVFD